MTREDTNKRVSYGEILSTGTLIDIMTDRTRSGKLCFVTSDGNPSNFLSKFELNGHTYHPPELSNALLRAVTFPIRLGKRLAISKLVAEISNALCTNLLLAQDPADLISFFCLTTWFPDFLPIAPSLSISGIDQYYGYQVVQLVARLCRRPLLLGNTGAGWNSVADLHPTIALFDSGSSAALGAGLEGSNYPGLNALHRSGVQNFCFSKIVFSPPGSMHPLIEDGSNIQIALATPPSFVRNTTAVLEEISNRFQPLLLTRRLANWQKVQSSRFEVREFSFPTSTVAAALGACLDGDSNLESRMIGLLRGQDDAARTERLVSPEPALVEVLLGAVHKTGNQPGKGTISVKKITELLNAALRSRGSRWEHSEEEVGWKLRKLGVPATGRNAKGKRMVLPGISTRVHRLARSYGISMQPISGPMCAECEHMLRDQVQVVKVV